MLYVLTLIINLIVMINVIIIHGVILNVYYMGAWTVTAKVSHSEISE